MSETYSGNDLTVVIPAHNCERYIIETLQSIESQTIRPRQVLVVENASNDGTRECIEGFAETSDLSLRLVHTACPGVSNARNIGFSLAETALIAMLDADDLYQPQFLERAVDAYNRVPLLALFFGNRKPLKEKEILDEPFLEKSRLENLTFEEPEADLRRITGDLFSELVYGSFVSCSGAVVSRQAAYDAGLFPTALSSSEDRFFFCNLALQGPAAYTLQTTHFYRAHEASRTGSSTWMDIRKNSLLCLHMLRLESTRKNLSSVQREALKQACTDSRAALFYVASEQGVRELRRARQWARHVGVSASSGLFFWLKAAKNGLASISQPVK
jgi:glycosyltransferase involved in cell wall biosynthesis